MFDRVIKGATIADGTGGPLFTGDVAIQDGVIREVGRVTAAARETVDADGLLVTPGFVDIHSHYDGQVSWDSQLAPSFWHGVTTTIMGNCGVGFAPVRPDRRDWLIGLMEGVEDIPGAALADGISWEWETFPEYLDALSRRAFAMDVGAQIAHGALRAYVMGERGARNEPAGVEDVAAMHSLVAAAQAAGAFGCSTSRTIVHRAIDGEPVPGTFAAATELEALARAVAESGNGILEVAPAGILGEDLMAPAAELAWMVEISAKTGCPISFLCGQNHRQPEYWRQQLAECERARAHGARVTPQVFARALGTMSSLASKMHPFVHTEIWAELSRLPFDERIARLVDAASLREKMAAQGRNNIFAVDVDFLNRPETWASTFVVTDPPDYEPGPEASIYAIAQRTGCDPRLVALETMLADGGRSFLMHHGMGYAHGNLDAEREMLASPFTVIGGGDGGAHVAIICDASMPSFLLTHWARDRARGELLPLEFLVKKQTQDTARLFGLKDRGIVSPGLRADLNVIDHARLRLTKPTLVHDLPTGAPRLMQIADGILATYVAGEPVRIRNDDTGARPGRLLRSGTA